MRVKYLEQRDLTFDKESLHRYNLSRINSNQSIAQSISQKSF